MRLCSLCREPWQPDHMCPQTLTYEEMKAGAPCPSCGKPWAGTPWPWPDHVLAVEEYPPERRAIWDAEQERYRAEHGECHAHRHSLNGYLEIHCGSCCPPPPLSQEQVDRIAALLGQGQGFAWLVHRQRGLRQRPLGDGHGESG